MAPQYSRNAAPANLPVPVAEAAGQNNEPDATLALATDDQDALMLDLDRLLQDSLPIGTDNETTLPVGPSRSVVDALQEYANVAGATVNSTEHLPQQEVEDDWILIGDNMATADQAENLVGGGSWAED